MNPYSGTVLLVFILIVFLVVLLIARDIAVWYFKINERIKQNDKIIKLLTEIRDGKH